MAASLTDFAQVLTIIEPALFTREAEKLWSETTRDQCVTFLSQYPNAGQVIPGSGGCRKLRWGAPDRGKRGGIRLIYFNRLNLGEIWLLMIYAKSTRSDLSAHQLKEIRDALKDL